MKNKGFPEHTVKTVRSLYVNTRIKMGKGNSVSNKEIYVSQGVKQGCPMVPLLFNIFIDKVIIQLQDVLTQGFKVSDTVLNSIIFADDQAIFSDSEAGIPKSS
jgi:hypothetical protein